MGQPFADPEVGGVVDRGLGAYRPPLFVVLLDSGVLVVHVQARGDSFGDHPGAERAWCRAWPATHQPPVEDQRNLVGAADVEVVADDLLEKDPTRDGAVHHLGQGELGLQDRDLWALAGGATPDADGMREYGQPLAQQGVDLLGSEPIADRLQRRGVLDRGGPVVQRLARYARRRAL